MQAKTKALGKCEATIVAHGSGGPCPDAKAAATIDKATAKLSSTIGRSCGGDDQLCGGDLQNEDLPATLGWPTDCPNFERGFCDGPIQNCGDIASCLVCLGNSAVDQAIDLYYDDLILPSSGALERCQASIGKATSTFLRAKSKALQRCWDAELNGKLAPGATCIAPDPGDGKYLAAIAKAENKKKDAICKACGGPDQTCNGTGDVSPVAIGFPTACPAVTIPGGAACGGPITDLNSLVTCVDCVTEFKVDCIDRAQVPGAAAYPTECNACVAPPASGPCPSAVEYTVDGARYDLDLGVSGLAHDIREPSNARLTLAVSGCAGANQPACGQCTVSGPVANDGGATFDNHRCQDQPWVACGADVDCTNAGAAGPCTYFFGPPQGFSMGGIPTCLLNRITSPIAGTIDFDDGASSLSLPLASGVHFTSLLAQPCPSCRRVCSNDLTAACAVDGDCPGGTCGTMPLCSDGPRQDQACTPQGSGTFGTASLDCPPNPATLAATHHIAMELGTDTQTRTLTAASPTCRETGFSSFRCLCDTCNNASAQPCFSNADCPLSGGNPGICGGRRCIGGGNDGAPCTINSACPSGLCNRPGEATKPNACLDDTNNPGLDCVDIGNNEGQCSTGPSDARCSVETFRSCATTSDCNPPPSGTCPDCPALGQSCVDRHRACFLDNGAIGGSVSVSGSPDVPCGDVAKPTLGALFCLAPAQSGSFTSFYNAGAGLPGLGRIRIPSVMRTLP